MFISLFTFLEKNRNVTNFAINNKNAISLIFFVSTHNTQLFKKYFWERAKLRPQLRWCGGWKILSYWCGRTCCPAARTETVPKLQSNLARDQRVPHHVMSLPRFGIGHRQLARALEKALPEISMSARTEERKYLVFAAASRKRW